MAGDTKDPEVPKPGFVKLTTDTLLRGIARWRGRRGLYPRRGEQQSVCVVAIARDEHRFFDEWLCYHRRLGVDHFFVYDDGPEADLKHYLQPHAAYVTVIDWHTLHERFEGRNRQTKAYEHAAVNYAKPYDWVAFIDIDEFITIRGDNRIKPFLHSVRHAHAVSLNWHVFGHSGHYEDPQGLVIETLTRRMREASRMVKTIVRPAAIREISSPHAPRYKADTIALDGDGRRYVNRFIPRGVPRAHINHYQCRSFSTWMRRVQRGDPIIVNGTTTPEHAWRTTYDLCLRQFVETVALNKNEITDTYLCRHGAEVKAMVAEIRAQRASTAVATTT